MAPKRRGLRPRAAASGRSRSRSGGCSLRRLVHAARSQGVRPRPQRHRMDMTQFDSMRTEVGQMLNSSLEDMELQTPDVTERLRKLPEVIRQVCRSVPAAQREATPSTSYWEPVRELRLKPKVIGAFCTQPKQSPQCLRRMKALKSFASICAVFLMKSFLHYTGAAC